jgi:hypothetical protein
VTFLRDSWATWCLLRKFYRNLTSLLRLPALAPLYFASYALALVVSPRSCISGRHWGFGWVVLRRACRIEASNVLPMRIMAEPCLVLQSSGRAPAVGGHAPYARGIRPLEVAAGMHCVHAIRGACLVSRGKHGRGEVHSCTDRGRWPRQLFFTYRTERKELCRIRWYIDREQETAGIGMVSGRER